MNPPSRPDILDPLHFDSDKWTKVSSSGLTDGMFQHEETGEYIDENYFEMLLNQSRAIEEAAVVPVDELRELQYYFEKRTDDNARKSDTLGDGAHAGISVGRKRSAKDIRDLIDEYEGAE